MLIPNIFQDTLLKQNKLPYISFLYKQVFQQGFIYIDMPWHLKQYDPALLYLKDHISLLQILILLLFQFYMLDHWEDLRKIDVQNVRLVFVLDEVAFYIVEIEIYRLSIALLLLEDLALCSHHLLEDTGNAELAMDLLPTLLHLFY